MKNIIQCQIVTYNKKKLSSWEVLDGTNLTFSNLKRKNAKSENNTLMY